MIAIIFTLLLALPLSCSAERQIWLLMGQSNAAGMGQEPPPIYQRADRIFVYANSGRWREGREPVDEPEDQVDVVSRDAKSGVGIGMAFADRLLELRPDITEVGLVPCAKGGATLARWAPHWSRQSLYGSCLARALEAAGDGRIAGVLWWQGEDESASSAPVYTAEFAKMIRALRNDLGALWMPVLYARIRGATAVTAVVRQQQEGITARAVRMVSTDGVGYPDGWHPDTDGYQTVGRRFAEAAAEF